MMWYQWFALTALIICCGSLLFHFLRLLRLGKPKDHAQAAGEVSNAVRYSMTGAMSPLKKESAFMNLPTYTAGILYHIGTFLSIFVFFLLLFDYFPHGWFRWVIIGFSLITGLSGLSILIKRVVKKELRALSNPDDYISNILVTSFHLLTALVVYDSAMIPVYFIVAGLLLLYIPLGKLKHTIYFFAARYHLGFFYGTRGVWPPEKIKTSTDD